MVPSLLQSLHSLTQQFRTSPSLLTFPVPPTPGGWLGCFQCHWKNKNNQNFLKLSPPQLPTYRHLAPRTLSSCYYEGWIPFVSRFQPLSLAQGHHSSNSIPFLLYHHSSPLYWRFPTNRKICYYFPHLKRLYLLTLLFPPSLPYFSPLLHPKTP